MRFMLSVIMLIVVMPSVVAHYKEPSFSQKTSSELLTLFLSHRDCSIHRERAQTSTARALHELDHLTWG